MRNRLLLNAAFLFSVFAVAEAQQQISVIPMPSVVQFGSGQLKIDRFFSIAITGFPDAALERGVQRFVAEMSLQTGIPFRSKLSEASSPTLLIRAEQGREAVQKLGEDESYALAINESGAKLVAPEDEYHASGTLYSLTKPLASPGKSGPQWNTLDITLDGSRTIVLLNEVEVRLPISPRAIRSQSANSTSNPSEDHGQVWATLGCRTRGTPIHCCSRKLPLSR